MCVQPSLDTVLPAGCCLLCALTWPASLRFLFRVSGFIGSPVLLHSGLVRSRSLQLSSRATHHLPFWPQPAVQWGHQTAAMQQLALVRLTCTHVSAFRLLVGSARHCALCSQIDQPRCELVVVCLAAMFASCSQASSACVLGRCVLARLQCQNVHPCLESLIPAMAGTFCPASALSALLRNFLPCYDFRGDQLICHN